MHPNAHVTEAAACFSVPGNCTSHLLGNLFTNCFLIWFYAFVLLPFLKSVAEGNYVTCIRLLTSAPENKSPSPGLSDLGCITGCQDPIGLVEGTHWEETESHTWSSVLTSLSECTWKWGWVKIPISEECIAQPLKVLLMEFFFRFILKSILNYWNYWWARNSQYIARDVSGTHLMVSMCMCAHTAPSTAQLLIREIRSSLEANENAAKRVHSWQQHILRKIHFWENNVGQNDEQSAAFLAIHSHELFRFITLQES